MTRRDVNSRSGSVYGGVGQPDHGLSFLEEALARAARSDERWYEAELHRLRGEVLALVPRREAEVEAALLRAITVAQEQGARMWELRAATTLSNCWRDQGQLDEARALLGPIYGWFTEGF